MTLFAGVYQDLAPTAFFLVKSEISVACRYSSRYNGILVNLAR